MVEVLLFDEQVNVDRPDVSSFGIVTQNTLKYCFASFIVSILEFILENLTITLTSVQCKHLVVYYTPGNNRNIIISLLATQLTALIA